MASISGLIIPAKDECILYKGPAFEGKSYIFKGYNNFAMSDVSFENAASSFMCGSEVFAYFCLNGATTIDDCLNHTASTTAGRISNPSM